MRLRADVRRSSPCRNVADDDAVRTDANALRDYLRDGGRHTGERDTLVERSRDVDAPRVGWDQPNPPSRSREPN